MAPPKVWVDPSLKVPVAVYRCFWPTESVRTAGVTATLSNVDRAATVASAIVAHNTSARLTDQTRVFRSH
jgi:hypothetical protein